MSVLAVAEPALWDELSAAAPIAPHLGEALSPVARIALPSFEDEGLRALRAAGVEVLERFARRPAEVVARERAGLEARVLALPAPARRVLHAAQRHALGGVVLGVHAWDPVNDADAVRALYQIGALRPAGDDAPYEGAYALAADLPDPPPVPYDFADAVMDETDDLAPPRPGPVRLLHDLAALAAALRRQPAVRTHAGTLAKADARRIGRALGVPAIAQEGRLEEDPRWGLALRALEALGGASFDPFSREVFVDLGLEDALRGSTPDAVDRLVHRLLDRDLHVVVPAVRAALRQAGAGAVDEVIFLDECRLQHREMVFPRWSRPEGEVYPHLPGETPRGFDDAGWERVEVPMIGAVLRRLEKLGLIRRAPGVFAATEEGRVWAQVADRPTPPLWVGSDLEVIVPPEALTPGERYDLERLGVALARDVVDRYRLDRGGVRDWLTTRTIDEALALLEARSPGVPEPVRTALRGWAASAERVVLTRGVLLDA